MEGEGNAQAVVRRRADGGGHTLSSMIGSEPAFAACLAAALGIDSSTPPPPEGPPRSRRRSPSLLAPVACSPQPRPRSHRRSRVVLLARILDRGLRERRRRP